MPMIVKRIGLAVVSLVLGFAFTYFFVEVILQTSVSEYWIAPDGLPYYLLTSISFAFVFALILDRFVGTELLPK